MFTIDDPHKLHARLDSGDLGSYTYEVTITGSGAGTVAIGATASSGQDTGGLAEWTIADPPTNTTIPRFSLQGHEHANPSIIHAEIISEPEDGMSYKAGERIEVFFAFSEFLDRHVPRYGRFVVWHRRRSTSGSPPGHSIPSEYMYHHVVYAYTVQSGDARHGWNPTR